MKCMKQKKIILSANITPFDIDKIDQVCINKQIKLLLEKKTGFHGASFRMEIQNTHFD